MKFILLLLTAAFLTGCAGLDGYDRSYSIGYKDAQGRELNTGATFRPKTKPNKQTVPLSQVLRAIFVEPYPYSTPAYAGAYVPTYVGAPCYP